MLFSYKFFLQNYLFSFLKLNSNMSKTNKNIVARAAKTKKKQSKYKK